MVNKRIPLVMLMLVIAVIMLLVATLPRLSYTTAEFQFDALPQFQSSTDSTVESDSAEEPFVVPPMFRNALLWVAAGLLLFYALSSADMRARLRRQILGTISVCLTVYVIIQYVLPAFLVRQQVSAGTGSGGGPGIAAPINPILVYGTSAVVAALIVGGIWLLVITVRRRRDPLDDVAHGARAALADLDGGKDVRETILRCYVDMNRAVNQSHGMRRQPAMTPREFESRLALAGLPSRQIERLTRLFEKVRYGGHDAGQAEIMEARDCLTDILHMCEARA
jgi:hypothetical protein